MGGDVRGAGGGGVQGKALQGGGGVGRGGQCGGVVARGNGEHHGLGGGRLPVDEQHLDGGRLAAQGHLVPLLAAGALGERGMGREYILKV